MTVLRGTSSEGGFTAHRRASLLITTAMVAASCAVAHAGTVTVSAPVPPATSTPVGTVNTAIVTDISTPSSDLTLDIKAGAVVTGGNIVLNPSAGSGDGAVVVTNAGSVGTVNVATDAVTDASGIVLNGSLVNGTKNTATVTNNGLVTGGLVASGFGGTVKIDNSGTIHNGLTASGAGDVSLNTTSVGAVRSGSVSASSFDSKFDPVTGTSTTTSGNVSIVQDGAAVSADGTTKVNISAFSAAGKADVSVNAVAGNVAANAGGVVKSQSLSTAPAAGKAVDTFVSSTTIGGGAATVTIGSAGDVGFVSSNGAGGSTVTVDGKVNGNASANSNFNEFSQVFSETRDAADATTEFASKSANKQVGNSTKLTVGKAGSVTGNANAITSGTGDATITVDGTVGGAVTANAIGTSSANTSKTTLFPAAPTDFITDSTQSNSAIGGAASVTVNAGGKAGFVIATGDKSAAVTNAGTISGVSANSSRFLSPLSQSQSQKHTEVTSATGSVITDTSSFSQQRGTAGGTVSVANSAGGVINGGISAVGQGDVTVSNDGIVLGTTNAVSSGSLNSSTSSSSDVATTVFGTPPALDVTTTVHTESDTDDTSSTGGSVTGYYAFANGDASFGSAVGHITQSADKASTATISGSVVGNVNSTAGNGFTNSFASNSTITQVVDTAGNGTLSGNGTDTSKFTRNAGGVSTVTVTGAVKRGQFLGSANVNSTGREGSSVTVNSGLVEGSVSVTALGNDVSDNTTKTSGSQTITAFNNITDSVTESGVSSSSVTAGDASANLLGSAKVDNSVSVFGVQSASAKIDSAAKLGGTLSVNAGGFDSSSSFDNSYARDAKTGVATAKYSSQSSSQAALASGKAVADVAGTVAGGVNVGASRGDATATVTGTVGGSVSTNSNGGISNSTSVSEYSGKAAGGNFVSPPSLSSTLLTKTTSSSSFANIGGKGTVLVDTAPALQALDQYGVNGSVSANGVGGASATVTKGSKVGGFVSANSTFSDSADSNVTNYKAGIATDSTSTSSSKMVGGSATVTNGGTISGASANGATSALVANTGKIGGSVSASSLGFNTDTTIVDTALNIPAQRQRVTTNAYSAVGGDARITNAAGAIINGSAFVAGKTGSVVNDGAINGGISVGSAVFNHSTSKTETVQASGPEVATAPAALFDQTYTVDQNGTSRGISVGGANITGPDGLPLKTSNITATVNLNSGSATLGSIVAERDSKTGAFQTNTTVNLNGSGFLGSDDTYTSAKSVNLPAANPVLVLSDNAQKAGFGAFDTPTVQVLGVAALNKNGAGTFVINGAAYQAPAAAALQPSWTLDVGKFAVNAGEVQLSLGQSPSPTDVFGIKGDVVNSATLVVGRRVTSAIQPVGSSLTSAGPESIRGINVVQTGNFSQGTTGTLVVGVNPSLVRFGNLGVDTGSSANELLGPITASVGVPFFTTPENGSTASTPSSWTITGDLNLAGKVVTNVSKDSIFSNGDGYTLFSYTGAGTVDPATLKVDTSLTSKFVSLGLKHDTTAKTVALVASRTSYATGATNPNAVNAATALDSAIPQIVSTIKADAAGNSAFSSVGQIGRAQDIANIVSGLDWRLNSAQAAQVFDELSSAEFYGSLSSVRQNIGFTSAAERLTIARPTDSDAGASLWFSPVANFAKYGGTNSGASKTKVNSYGGAFGLDLGYGNGGAFGFGFGYVQHDASARGTAEEGQVRTYTLGAYWTQRFRENFYANAQFSYGFSKFKTERELALLARTISADFKGSEWDGSIQVGYDFKTNGNLVVTPFGELALRHWSMDGFTETGGAGIGLAVDKASKTVFNPTFGVKLGASIEGGAFTLKPYGKLSYTFQGNMGNERTVRYLGGGNSFTLEGVDPDGFGKIEAGIEALMNDKLGVFFGVGYGFGGQQNVGRVQGGINVNF